MRIGFANIYSWRPHVEHLYYLARLVEQAGHQTAFLTCDSSVSDCYTRLLKGKSRLKECPACMLGGVRSYPVSNITSISRGKGRLDVDTLDKVALSSSCTLTRTESELEWHEPQVEALRRRLHAPVGAAYESAMRWIADERLEGVVCFNGRMDMMAAVILACEHSNIPYVTHERSWFGDGLYLNPNANCLSLRAISAMVAAFDDRPLTASQAALAGRLAAERFLRSNRLEWRLYNKNPVSASWPISHDGPRVLVLPSSKNEFAGQPEWRSDWPENTRAVDELMEALAIRPEQMVVRCHPNWAETIGVVEGNRSLQHYKEWCAARGVYCISSEEKQSTYDLIEQADIVVLNGGSSAVEAGVLGKQIYSLGPSFYKDAGFLHNILDRRGLSDPTIGTPLDQMTVVRKTMRFLYLNARRFPQFTDYVKAIETTHYRYFEGANPQRLIDMLKSGTLEADDPSYAADDSAETPIADALLARDWPSLMSFEPERPERPPLDLGRRRALRWLDRARARMPKGDII